MDFFKIKERCPRKGVTEIYPDFKVCKSKDLMIRGKAFYAVWDEELGLWSTDEYDVQRLVDKELSEYRNRMAIVDDSFVKVLWMSDFSTNSWTNFKNYVSKMPDNSVQLDERLTFADTIVTKKDYVSRRLGYSLKEEKIDAYQRLCSELYDQDERDKLEWAIGAIISGDARDIQKFIVLYGEAGTGKSTILNIVQGITLLSTLEPLRPSEMDLLLKPLGLILLSQYSMMEISPELKTTLDLIQSYLTKRC